jgi:hypothetical protein
LGKTSKVNDDSQEVVTICKSTRLKNFQISRIKIFMVNEDHKLNNQSEQIVSNANESNNNSDKTSSSTCVNGCSEKTSLVGRINTLTTLLILNTEVSSQANKSKIKLSLQPNDSVPLTVYHQNIRGLGGKANELLSQLCLTFLHILCLSEHHMNHFESQQTFLDIYYLGVTISSYEKGGICIFVQKSLRYISIDLEMYCKNKDFEVCGIKIYLNTKSAYIIAIYRAPSSSFDLFITKLDTVLRELYTSTLEYIICGDININYLVDSDRESLC